MPTEATATATATTTAKNPITVRISGRNLFIDFIRLDSLSAEKIRRMPGGYLCQTGAMMYSATMVYGRRLQKLFGVDAVRFTGNDAPAFVTMLGKFDLAHRMRDEQELPDVPGEKMPSWLHQKRGFWFGFHMPRVLLSEKVGAGKTKQMIDICCNRNHKRILVVTTASAVDDWPTHVAKHSTLPYAVLALGVDWRSKNATRKAEAVKRYCAANEYVIVVVSYDSAYRPPLGAIIKNVKGGSGAIGALEECKFDCLIPDEIHNASDPSGRRSLFLWRLAERIPYCIAATGTIVKHKPEDVFSPFRILDSGIFGPRKEPFLKRYCIFNRPSDEEIRENEKRLAAGQLALPGMENIGSGDVGPRFVVAYKNTDELGRLMSAVTYDPGEVDLHLPVPIFTTRRAFLSLKARRVYDDLETEAVAILPDETEVVAPNVLTQLLRLHQCAGGFIGEPIIDKETGEIDFVEIHEIDKAKETLLEETLLEIDPDDPVVIVGRFKHDIEVFRRTCKRIGRKFFEQSGRRKERIAWQQASGGEALCAQIQSACEAIDLTRSRYMILYSVGFSLYQITQMYGREDRPGQTRQPNYIHLVTSDTIDEKIYKAIQSRANVAQEIMRNLKAARYAR